MVCYVVSDCFKSCLSFLVLNGYHVPYSQPQIVAAANHRAFQPATSPGPLDQLYSPTNELALANYGQPTSPQPGTFPNLALNSRVSDHLVLYM